MSTYFNDFYNYKKSERKITSIYCDKEAVEKMELIARPLRWSRNSILIESILHIIRLIENKNHPFFPTFVLQLHDLEYIKSLDIKFTLKKGAKKKSTAINIHPVILNKVEHISKLIGWSRNAFIEASIYHTLRMVENKNFQELPPVVTLAQAVSNPINNFSPQEVKQADTQEKANDHQETSE
jgi:hypothetical protein